MSYIHRKEYIAETGSDFTSQIADNLKLGSPIATGSFGDVYRCTVESCTGKTEVAVKVFKIDPKRTMDKLTTVVLRELMVWLRLKHLNIVPLLGTAQLDSPLPALVSQWMSSGTLFKYLEDQATTITPSARIELVKGIAEGVNYLHSMNVIHGDLHPGNVLIDDSGNPRLVDFGLATVAEVPELQWSTTTLERGFDSRWRAPEVIGIEHDPKRPTFKSDICSLGSAMFFIVSGVVPWKEKNHPQICVELWKKNIPTLSRNIFGFHRDLIKNCWSWEPVHRPEAKRVLQDIAKYAQEISMSTKNIVLFGETGAGKSSVVNLMAGRQSARTSPNAEGCTLHPITFDGCNYRVFYTVGLEEPQLGMENYLDIIVNGHDLITHVRNEGGIDLLLFCVRAGRVTATIQSNYRLFYEYLCEKKVPIVLVLTGLEREQRMEDWWDRNKSVFDRYGINVAGHACITAAHELDGRHQQLYEESRRLVRNLVIQHTHGRQGGGYSGGEGWFRMVVQELRKLIVGNSEGFLTKKGIKTILTTSCGMPPEAAGQLASKIISDLRVAT